MKTLMTVAALMLGGTAAVAQGYEAMTVSSSGRYGVGWGSTSYIARQMARNMCQTCGEIVSAQSYGSLIGILCRENGWQNSFIGGGRNHDQALRDAVLRANAEGFSSYSCSIMVEK